MVWSRTILDGIILCLIFNLTVAVTWIFIPCAFSKMLPKEIRLAAPPRKRKEVVILACVLYPLYLLIFAYILDSRKHDDAIVEKNAVNAENSLFSLDILLVTLYNISI